METVPSCGHNQREYLSCRETTMSDALPNPEQWAARTLGIPEGIDEASARAALLRELASDGFVPPLVRQIAWTAFLDPQAPLPDAARRAAEVRLRAEIDDFAAEFFSLAPEERGRQWQTLAARAAGSASLAARLAALEPGLNVVPPAQENPKVARLSAAVVSLFVLAPLARAAQRQAVLHGMKADMAAWEAAARVLSKTAPAIAALDSPLMDSIRFWQKVQANLEQARAGARPRARSAPKAPVAAPRPSGSSQLPMKTLIWIGIVVIGGGARVCSGLGSHSSNSAPPPRFEQPRFQPVDVQKQDDWQRMLEQIQKQQDEDRKRQQQWQKDDDPPGRVKGFGPDEDEKPRRP
jgi:hypothetical protein